LRQADGSRSPQVIRQGAAAYRREIMFRSHVRPAVAQRLHANRRLRFESLEPRRVLAGVGLTAQYFHNPDFTGLAAERVESPNFAWGVAAPAPGMDADSFSVRWFGRVEAQFSETYAFRTVSDDGVRLWVDGKLLIDGWGVNAARVESGTIDLQAGEKYDIRLEYFDGAGSAQMRLQWASASQPLQAIPAAQLYESLPGLVGAYSDAAGNANRRTDAAIDFDWGFGPPISGVDADDFQVRWTGYLRADASANYQFRVSSDERVRLWIGEDLIVDHWTPHTLTQDIGVKQLEAGKWYDVRAEYADVGGDAQIALAWLNDVQSGDEFAVIPAANLRAAREAPLVAANPLGPGQDPFVIQWEGSYYHVRSAGNSVWIDRADRLEDIHPTNPNSVSSRVWTAPAGTSYSSQIWAPELHQLNGKWYVYVAASNGVNANHRMHVLERDAPDPMGPYVYKGQLAPTTDRWAIDGTVLEWQGALYFIWSGWPGATDGQQNLYIAEMSNPWTISGERVLLSSPTYNWETFGLRINEGPQILIHDGQLHVIYSASGYWTHQYALGRLTYDGVGPIMSASSWTKAPTPVFRQAGDIVGTGHASFVKSPDGTQNWIVYHAHHDRFNWQDNRDVFIQQFTFDADGTPNFGAPLPRTTPVQVPSGYVSPNRTLVPGDYDASGTTDAADLAVFAGLFGMAITPGISADGDADGFVDGNDFLLWQRNFGASAPVAAPLDFANESAVVAALHAAEEPAVESPSAPLLQPEFVDLAFAADAYWRAEPRRQALQPTRRPAANHRPTSPREAPVALSGRIDSPRPASLRTRPESTPADADESAGVNHFFPGLGSASES
jgi:GH43 family beta-xylosidase